MKLCLNYGDAVVVLPRKLLWHINRASEKDLRVLLALTSDPVAALDLDAAMKNAAASLSISEHEVESALSFWRGTGFVSVAEGESTVAVPTNPAVKTVMVSDLGLPNYSSEELASVLERRKDVSALINECQRTFGKVFNTKEVSIIVGLTDYLGLTGEYILLLLAHCVRMGKKSLRDLGKMAISLRDDGVQDTAELEARLTRIEMMPEVQGRISAIFGISDRPLTTKEKKHFEKWFCVMRYDDDILRMAYERMIDNKGEYILKYADKILQNWFDSGYRTVEDIEQGDPENKAENKQKKKKSSSPKKSSLFEAALKRTEEKYGL